MSTREIRRRYSGKNRLVFVEYLNSSANAIDTNIAISDIGYVKIIKSYSSYPSNQTGDGIAISAQNENPIFYGSIGTTKSPDGIGFNWTGASNGHRKLIDFDTSFHTYELDVINATGTIDSTTQTIPVADTSIYTDYHFLINGYANRRLENVKYKLIQIFDKNMQKVLDLVPAKIGSKGVFYDRVSGNIIKTGGYTPGPKKLFDENSYVLDGLAFLLDGINKGSNIGYWTDLIGGTTFTIPTSEYLTEETNGFTWTGGASMTKASGSIPSGTGVTVEIAMYDAHSKNPLNRWGCFASASNNAAGSLCIGQFDTKFGFINRTSTGSYNDHVFRGFSTTSANADRICTNKKESSMSSTTSSDYMTGYGAIIGNAYVYAGMLGTIYAIRIYNKKMTLGEMIYNQEVDLKRFK